MKELIEALKTIQAECGKQNGRCEECPMGAADGVCCIMDTCPDHWDIIEPIVRVME